MNPNLLASSQLGPSTPVAPVATARPDEAETQSLPDEALDINTELGPPSSELLPPSPPSPSPEEPTHVFGYDVEMHQGWRLKIGFPRSREGVLQ